MPRHPGPVPCPAPGPVHRVRSEATATGGPAADSAGSGTTDGPATDRWVTDMRQEDLPVPATGLLLTHFLTVADVARSRAFYTDVLGGEVVLAENPCIVKLANSWLIMNPGGGPTPDKPGVTLRPPDDPDTATSFLNIRVADIDACYRLWSGKGAEFLTPPIDRKAELRCYLRDPDGYLIEVGQATGLLRGVLADPPAGNG